MDINPTTPAKLYALSNDMYAKESVVAVGDIKVLIQEANSWTRGGNIQTLSADSIAMVTRNGLQSLVDNARVEGYILHVEPFNDISWYRITSVAIARDLALTNTIKHYELSLVRSKKIAGLV